MSNKDISSIDSPEPKKHIGTLFFLMIDIPIPPFALPSTLLSTTPLIDRYSLNRLI